MTASAFGAGYSAGFGAAHVDRRLALMVTSPYHDGDGNVLWEPGTVLELPALTGTPPLPDKLMVTDVIVDSVYGVVAAGYVQSVVDRRRV